MNRIDTRLLEKLMMSRTTNSPEVVKSVIAGLIVFFAGLIISSYMGFAAVWYTASLVAVSIYLIYIAIKSILHDKAVLQEFARINNLAALPPETMAGLLPPILGGKAYGCKFNNGYVLNINGQPIYTFDYSYKETRGGSEKYRRYHSIAVVRSRKSYPHIYLDGRRDGKSGVYKTEQRMMLEGDFNKYFDLYAERATSIETLSFLTPDVMQSFIDSAQLYDIETYGNNVYVIVSGTTVYTKPNLDRLIRCLEALVHEVPVDPAALPAQVVAAAPAAQATPKLKRRSRVVATIAGYIIATIYFGFILLRWLAELS